MVLQNEGNQLNSLWVHIRNQIVGMFLTSLQQGKYNFHDVI